MNEAIQQLAETILINAMNGGELAGMVFRHGDNAQRSRKTSISVQAGAPVPQLEGPRGHRIEVEVTIKTEKPNISATWHATILQRLTNMWILRNAAVSAGLDIDRDDLYIFDDEFSGDRVETKNLRKRSIVVPMLINQS